MAAASAVSIVAWVAYERLLAGIGIDPYEQSACEYGQSCGPTPLWVYPMIATYLLFIASWNILWAWAMFGLIDGFRAAEARWLTLVSVGALALAATEIALLPEGLSLA